MLHLLYARHRGKNFIYYVNSNNLKASEVGVFIITIHIWETDTKIS